MSRLRSVVATVHLERGSEHLLATVTSLLERDLPVVVVDSAPQEDRPHADQAIRELPEEVEVIRAPGGASRGEGRNLAADSSIVAEAGDSPILYFTNNGTVLQSDTPTERIRDELDRPTVGAVGGLILSSFGAPLQHNFGPIMRSVPRALSAYGTATILKFLELTPDIMAAERWRRRLNFLLGAWPNTFEKPSNDWVGRLHEGSLAIGVDTFNQVGRFPPVNVHETQSLAHRLHLLGQVRIFTSMIRSQELSPRILSGVRPDSLEGIYSALVIARSNARLTREDEAERRMHVLADPLER